MSSSLPGSYVPLGTGSRRAGWSLAGSGPAVSAGPAGDEARHQAYFEEIQAAFARAERASGPVERRYAIGPLVVRLRFAGPALVAALTRALAHLRTEADAPADVTISLFDRASTAAAPPPPAWGVGDYGVRGEIAGFETGRFRAAYDVALRALSMADLARGLAVFCIADARDVPYYERGAPVRAILHWMLGARGCQLAHGAAVGTPDGGVLLAGRGGSGKSTSALACIEAGWRYAGDDYVALQLGALPVVHSLYNTAKVDGAQLDRFPRLRPLVDNAARLTTEKALIFLAPHVADRLSRGFPLRALLLPRITGHRATRLVRASPAAALSALAPTTMFQLPGETRRTFAMLGALARDVPCHWLEIGTDLAQIPPAIAEALGR